MDHIRAWAEVDLNRLAANTRAIRSVVPKNTKILAAVKGDAYGHGAEIAPKTLLENGVDTLGVAFCEEGVALRESGITAPILVMSYTPKSLIAENLKHNLIQTIFSDESYHAISRVCKAQNKRAQVHIKIDTGMNRLGFLSEKSNLSDLKTIDTILQILHDPCIKITGIYTHLATSENTNTGFMLDQYSQFNYILNKLKEAKVPVDAWTKHIGNSGALLQMIKADSSLQDAEGSVDLYQNMMRLGIALYGLPPSKEMSPICNNLRIKPVMRLMSRISMIKVVPEGVSVSYGQKFWTKRETIIATLPIGYADGYPRALTNKGQVLVKGHLTPIIGAICMDQCMIDITDVPNARSIKQGEPVEIFGETFTAEDIAAKTDTIAYEVICAIGKRIPRIYIT